MAGVPLGALAALGGGYSSSVLPLLVAAAGAFLVTGGVVGMSGMKALDAWLVALGVAVALQLVPLPDGLVAAVSPHARALQTMLSLDTTGSLRPLAIDPDLTREGLESLAAALFIFWAARTTFTRGGLRMVLRILAAGGFAIAVIAVAQRATSPDLMWWTWAPLMPRAKPFGPFSNRNHFAAWLLMAIALTAGYTVAHMRSHNLQLRRPGRLLRQLLVEGDTLLLTGAIVAMVLTLFATTSRGAILGFSVALLSSVFLARHASGGRDGRRDLRVVFIALALVTAWAVWLNFDALSQRLVEGGPASRSTIWRETMPMIRDFPVTGTGLGTYAQGMLRYQQTDPDVLFNTAHSEYVQLAAEGGGLLMIPAIGAALWWLMLARRRLRDERGGLLWIRAGAAAGIIGIAVHAIWESPVRMIANAMLLAVLAAVVVHERESRPPGHKDHEDG